MTTSAVAVDHGEVDPVNLWTSLEYHVRCLVEDLQAASAYVAALQVAADSAYASNVESLPQQVEVPLDVTMVRRLVDGADAPFSCARRSYQNVVKAAAALEGLVS